jgi:NAD(P)-dependent dehydrogenase (short-subunit alcohol dehydrogenase family)
LRAAAHYAASDVSNRSQHLAARVALVTGAGRGIGRAHALRLASHGAAVVVNDIGVVMDGTYTDASPAADVVAEINAAGGTAIADHHDVSTFHAGEEIVKAAVAEFGRIDIVVNNAGIAADAPIEQLSEELLLRLLRVHYIGALGICRAVIPRLRAQGYGRVVNTVSEAALDVRFPGGIAYGGAKAAVWSATLSLARQVDGTGVTVNGLSPGARTRMNEEMLAASGSRLDLNPDHVAKVVAVLVGEAAGHVNGRIIHAAAGAVREYEVRRTANSPAVSWLDAAVDALEEMV